ncbi:zinc finger protein CONSTANS-LIKE 5 [Cucumis melo var. makuwa]|uniref:Zinc finger protein CONSTANS-LIKE 5 n=1 Tax=Cucumis melo var. makuwa TaxID=1194695 RepID=A0A5A7U7B4_CUCMM|nr:zinc finger protein CONSTANS-LIKE 5 [Cucumis melo var. makuwa]
MASIIPDQFYYDDHYTSSAAPPPTAASVGIGGGPFWGDHDETADNLVPLLEDDNFGALHRRRRHHQPYTDHHNQYYPSSDIIDPATWSFPQQDMLPSFPSHSHQNNNNNARGSSCQDFNCHLGCQLPDHQLFYEFQDDCFGLVPEIKPSFYNNNPLPTHNGDNQSNQVSVAEDSNMKVGRYSEEVRKQRILRYLKKRNQRNFNKTIKYACRKTLADRRIRVRGRFARNNEAISDQEVNPTTMNNDTTIQKDTELLYNHHDFGVQMKRDEEEWLQEISSIMYLPYISS